MDGLSSEVGRGHGVPSVGFDFDPMALTKLEHSGWNFYQLAPGVSNFKVPYP